MIDTLLRRFWFLLVVHCHGNVQSHLHHGGEGILALLGGARPLRRYVQHTVETMLSRKLLQGDLRPGSTVTVDVEQGKLIL